jgi:hypothetical protein
MRDTIRWDGTSPITIVSIERTCFACPAQWQGRTEHGDTIYIRCRHGGFSVALWANDAGDGWTDIVDRETEGNIDSWMSDYQMRQHLPEWITLPEDVGTPESHEAYEREANGLSDRASAFLERGIREGWITVSGDANDANL